MLDIELLRFIWWLILGVLFIGFAIMDGFDLGAAILFPLVARNETERRIVLNTIGPIWEGNQVWILLGAGAIFAAFPYVYGVAFSGAYLPVLLLLLTMGISRPVSFKYRSKLPSLFWRRFWDWVVFIGGFVPALVLGILVGNILLGIPFYFDENLRVFNQAHFFDLFKPFALWCGVTSVAMLMMHGGLYLAIKTEHPLSERCVFYSRLAAIALVFLFAGGGLWIAYDVEGYRVLSGVDHFGLSNPMHKQVVSEVGAWLNNYFLYPWTLVFPIIGFLGAMLAFLISRWNMLRLAFICSSLSVMGIIATVGISMFPFILPSSSNMTASLLVWDSSSSYLTLLIMLFAVIVFLPLILMYTSWVYYVLRGKVNKTLIEQDESHTAY